MCFIMYWKFIVHHLKYVLAVYVTHYDKGHKVVWSIAKKMP